jgi:hypothetical protein
LVCAHPTTSAAISGCSGLSAAYPHRLFNGIRPLEGGFAVVIFAAVFVAVLIMIYWRAAIIVFAVLLIALILLGLASVAEGLASLGDESAAPQQVTLTVLT